MIPSTLFAALLYLGGIAAVLTGLRTFLSRPWSPHIELRPPSEVRRAARIARIDDFRKRRIIDDPRSTWNPPDDRGPTAA